MEEPKDREISAHQKTPISSYGALSRRPNSFIQAYSLITTLMRIARRLLSASASSILLSEESSQRLIFAFADGSSGEQIRQLKISKNSGIAGWVVTNGEPLIVNDVYQDKHFNNFVDSVTGHTTKSIICVPLVLQDKIIGVVEIVNTLDGNDFSERDLNTLKIIAAPVAQVIDSIRRSKRNFITHNNAISMLLSAIEARKSSMNGHAKRVSQYALTFKRGEAGH
jgi:GAF domain-containing protein